MSLKIWLPLNGSTMNQGTAGFQPAAASVTYTTGGKVTNQCYISGEISMNATQSAQVLNNTAITIAFWINPQSTTTNSVIFGHNDQNTGVRQFSLFQFHGSDSSKHGTTLHWSWGGTMDAGANYDANGQYLNTNNDSTINNALPINTWTHVCVTYNNPTVRVYINGVLRAVRTYAVNYTFNQATPLINKSGNRYINDFRLYDHCLSPREVKLLAQGLVAHYKLDLPTINLLNGNWDYTNFANAPLGTYSSFSNQLGTNSLIEIREFNGQKCLYIKGGSGSNDRCFRTLSVSGDKTYTFSMDIYSTSSSIWIKCEANGGDYGSTWPTLNSATYTQLGQWQRISYTITPESNPNLFFFIQVPNGHEVYVNNFQLEENNNATQYTPINKTDNSVDDCSGYGNHGTQSSALKPVNDAPRYKNCIQFNGNLNDKILCNTTAFNFTDDFSWSCWIKHNYTGWQAASGKPPASFPFVVGRADAGGYGYGLQEISNTAIKVRFGSSSWDINNLDETWHHLAFTKIGTAINIYVDGIPTSQTFSGTLPTYSDGVGLAIGCFQYNGGSLYPYYGQLSDFRIYATTLSAAAVKELYQSSISLLDNGTLQCGEIVEKPTNLKYNKNGIVQAELLSEIGYTNKMKIKTLSDGSAWARIHWLDVTNDATYFDKSADEVQECINKTNRFSMLKYINHFYTSCLPTEYQRLDYIQPGGTYQNSPYIDTGVIPDNNTKIVLSYVHNDENEFGALFGARVATTNSVFGAWIGDSGGYYYPHWGNNSYNVKSMSGISLTDQRIYVMDKNNHKVYGTGGDFIRLSTNSTTMKSTAHDAATFNSTRTLALFSMHAEDGYDSRRARGKLYFCQIYQNGQLIRDFIPCANAQGTVGLYDLVNNQFYTKHNANNPNFIGGNAIDGHVEFMLTYPKISTTQYNRWRQTSGINQSTVQDFFPIETAWPDRNGGLCFSPAARAIYDCDAHGANWFAPIGQTQYWTETQAIPAANTNPTTETELWVRIDNLPKLTKLSMLNDALQAHQIYEL